jgi:hypothetical protein
MKTTKRKILLTTTTLAVVTTLLSGCTLPTLAYDYYGSDSTGSIKNTTSNTLAQQETATSGTLQYYSSKQEAIRALKSLTIVEDVQIDSDKASRVNFGSLYYYNGWDTIETYLEDIGSNLSKGDYGYNSGTWYLPYTGETMKYTASMYNTDEEKITADYVIPLNYVATHGGSNWTQDERSEYRNDYGEDSKWTTGDNSTHDYDNANGGVFVASDAATITVKGDSGPSKWMPSNKDYWVEYCERWIVIASTYGISLDQSDYDKILEVLEAI